MKKFFSIILSVIMIFSITTTTFASETNVTYVEQYTISDTTYVEQYTVSDALSNPEVYNYLADKGKLNELYQAQDEIRNNQYEITANCIENNLTKNELTSNDQISKVINKGSVYSKDVQQLTNKYGLQLPNEKDNVINNGTIYTKINSLGDIIDIWYVYYLITGSSFSVKVAMVDADNPLDIISGTITLYSLNNYTWTYKNSTTFNKTMQKNGTVCTWYVPKWGVKEKFEYDLTVNDNGWKHHYDNIGEDNYTRYNFEAGPYQPLAANGGQRHHFIPATSLRSTGFNSSTAYCIRMMTADHIITPSYGSSSYVKSITDLLKDKKYEDALRKEVEGLQGKMDSEGLAGNLQQKYYNEVIICLYQYEILFDIS